jgi:hypothetical protein
VTEIFNWLRHSYAMSVRARAEYRSAVTVIELIVVMAILVTVASVVIVSMNNAQTNAAKHLGFSEIQQLRQALLQFKAHTGFLPGQGPFNLDSRPGGWVSASNLPPYVPPAQTGAWFDSPANFWQLFENPLVGTGHPLENWNPNTGRGWNGPYLTRFGEGLVDVGDDLQSDGSGSPTAGAVLVQVVGVADPFPAEPQGPYLAWRSADGFPPHDRWGRPYLWFDRDDPDLARIVGMGPNEQYDAGANDDVVLELFR